MVSDDSSEFLDIPPFTIRTKGTKPDEQVIPQPKATEGEAPPVVRDDPTFDIDYGEEIDWEKDLLPKDLMPESIA